MTHSNTSFHSTPLHLTPYSHTKHTQPLFKAPIKPQSPLHCTTTKITWLHLFFYLQQLFLTFTREILLLYLQTSTIFIISSSKSFPIDMLKRSFVANKCFLLQSYHPMNSIVTEILVVVICPWQAPSHVIYRLPNKISIHTKLKKKLQ